MTEQKVSSSYRVSAIISDTTKVSRENHGSKFYSGMGSGFYFLHSGSVIKHTTVGSRENQFRH